MASRLRRTFLRVLSFPIPDALARWLARRWCRLLRTHMGQEITEGFLLLLLDGMDLVFCLSRRYRRNLRGFTGRYVFETEGGGVAVSALFRNGDMVVKDQAIDDWDAKITFRSEAALWAILLQGDDVFQAILHDQVTIAGNLNYVYKFGFMASDLTHVLGVS